MNATTEIVKTILSQPGTPTPEDILYCLHLKNEHPVSIAKSLGKSRSMVIHVIYGRHKSYDIATKISEVLQRPMNEIWGNRYGYTPRQSSSRSLVQEFGEAS